MVERHSLTGRNQEILSSIVREYIETGEPVGSRTVSKRRKDALTRTDARDRTPRWRRYACESFCDTAAWHFAGLRQHDEFTLAKSDTSTGFATYYNVYGVLKCSECRLEWKSFTPSR